MPDLNFDFLSPLSISFSIVESWLVMWFPFAASQWRIGFFPCQVAAVSNGVRARRRGAGYVRGDVVARRRFALRILGQRDPPFSRLLQLPLAHHNTSLRGWGRRR